MHTRFLYFRGLLDYKEKICKYWPEFAQNGKENVTIEHLMLHSVSVILTHLTHLSRIDFPIPIYWTSQFPF